MKYNAKPDHLYHRVAARIKANATPFFEKLDAQIASHPSSDPTNIVEGSLVGDLEPSIEVLRMYLNNSALDEENKEMRIEQDDPLQALFVQALFRALTPPPPPPRDPTPERTQTKPLARLPNRGRGKKPAAQVEQQDEPRRTTRGQPVVEPTDHQHIDGPESNDQTDGVADDSPTNSTEEKELARAQRREREREKRAIIAVRKERDRISREKYREKRKEMKRLEMEARAKAALAAFGNGDDGDAEGEVEEGEEGEHGQLGETDEAVAASPSHTNLDPSSSSALPQTQPSNMIDNSVPSSVSMHQTPSYGSSHKSHHSALSHSTHPQIVEEVNDKDSFTRFNEGWVLPEGSSRRDKAVPSIGSLKSTGSIKSLKGKGKEKEPGESGEQINEVIDERRGMLSFYSLVQCVALIRGLYLQLLRSRNENGRGKKTRSDIRGIKRQSLQLRPPACQSNPPNLERPPRKPLNLYNLIVH